MEENSNTAQNSQIEQYTNEENARIAGLKKLSGQKKNEAGPAAQKMGLATFALMLMVAALFDLISFGVNALPIIGGAIQLVTITPLAALTFWLWTKIKGISMVKGMRGPITAIVIAIGFIPVVNALPEWTCEILMLKASITLDNKLKRIPGIKKLTGK
jgi:hypothetical protein